MTTFKEIQSTIETMARTVEDARTMPEIIAAHEQARAGFKAIKNFRRDFPYVEQRQAYACHVRALRILVDSQLRFTATYHAAKQTGDMWSLGTPRKEDSVTLTTFGYKAGHGIKGLRRLWEAEQKFPGIANRAIDAAEADNERPTIHLVETVIDAALGGPTKAPPPVKDSHRKDMDKLKFAGGIMALKRLWKQSPVTVRRQFLREIGITDRSAIETAARVSLLTIKHLGAGNGRTTRQLAPLSSLPDRTYDDVMNPQADNTET